jgi:hypothetical protein
MYIAVHKLARYPVLIFIAGAAEFNIGHLPARFHFCPCAQPKDLLRPVSFKRYCSVFGKRGHRRALKYNPTNQSVVLCSGFLP